MVELRFKVIDVMCVWYYLLRVRVHNENDPCFSEDSRLTQ